MSDTTSNNDKPLWTTRDGKAPDPHFGYRTTSLALHWLTVLVVTTLFLTATTIHQSLGYIFAIILLGRIIWRVGRGFPRSADQPVFVNVVERLSILVMLLAMLVATISGLALPLASGQAIAIFNVVLVEPLLTAPLSFVPLLVGLHGLSAAVLLGALGVHLLFAVKHAITRDDGVLLRIIKPQRGGH